MPAATLGQPISGVGTPLAAVILAALYPFVSAGATSRILWRRLEEVVVTATRREVDLQNVPQSVSAFSTADIEKQGFQDVEDVVGALPSVNLVNNLPGRNEIVMRGISTGSDEYLDGQPGLRLSRRSAHDLEFAAGRGPADRPGADRGAAGSAGNVVRSSSQAGTIRYITNKPDPTGFGAQFDGESARPRAARKATTSAAMSISRSTDNFAVRVVGFYPRRAATSTTSSADT